jgi:WD40 repeat protein/serine/threonine protein kinase/DNA-binding SARP family transcriptional activator
MSMLDLSFFGRFQAVSRGEPLSSFRTQKVQALLIYLAAAPEKAHRREMLMTLLWPGMPEQSARANLRQVLFLLRQAIPDGEETLLIANRETIQLNPLAGTSSDIMQFDRLLQDVRNHDHLDLPACQVCSQKMASAVALYQGDFLADFYLDDSNEFEGWAEITRQSYRRKVLDALETLTIISLHKKAYSEARAYSERQLEIDNLRESAYRQLMEILALSGQRADALALYENFRRFFAQELSMSPSARTTELYEKIRMGEINLDQYQERGIRGYELKEVIGAGAYGIIHRAIQPAIGREVAVKIIQPRFANAPAFIRRFETEAQTIGRLEHPHIVPLYDYWRESDRAYLVMRLFRGGNLQAALESGPWHPDRVQSLLDQIAPALEAAHKQGIVHRDIKPANILFDENGNAYLSDFGIARDLIDERELMGEGVPFDTLDYVSPEQLQNGPISPQTDIYSLGAVVYEILSGEKPYLNVPRDRNIQNFLQGSILLVSSARPGLPALVDDVILRATSKLPSDRFSSVLEFSEAFRSAIGHKPQENDNRTFTSIQEAHTYNPYKGLRPFLEADASDFFGRENLVAQLVTRLPNSRFLAVVGPSGSGKSSVVKAGLIPALRQGALPGSENWYIAEMVPGTHPLKELELALLGIAVDPPASLIEPMERDDHGMLRTIRRVLPEGEDSQLFLVIDQFEELFAMVENEGRRSHFINSLLHAIQAPRTPLRVLVTLRADFYDRPLQYQLLAELFKQNSELVLPLNRDELLWAIQEPARQVGVKFEEGLVAEILADIGDQPGALPMVQFAMTELFTARENGSMTRRSYREIGGVLGAMTRRAEEIYNPLSLNQQELARQVLLRLVMPGEDVEVTRRRVRLTELQQLAEGMGDGNPAALLDEILDQFGAARLLTFDHDPATREPTVEVAHEALMRTWERLRNWLDQSRDDIRLQGLLSAAVSDWEKANQDESFLLQGTRLERFKNWHHETHLALMPGEIKFLEASQAAQARREQEEVDRRQRELDTARDLAKSEHQRALDQAQAAARLRLRAWLLAFALIVSVLLGLSALNAGQQALANEALAERSAIVSQSLAMASGASAAVADNNIDQALSLAIAANQIEDPPSFSQRVLYDVSLGPATIKQIIGGGGWRWSLDVHPDSHLVASGADDDRVILWDYTTGEEIRALEGEHSDSIGDLVFTRDGKYLLSGAYDDWMVLWEVETGKPVRRMFNPTGDVNGLDISPDGSLVIAGTEYGVATLWDLHSGDQTGEFVHNPELQVLPVKFSPDGRLAATGSEDGTVVIWDINTQVPVHKLATMDGVIFALDFSPDGKILAAGGSSDEIRLYETETGQPVGRLPGHPDWIFDLDFSPDGSQLLVAARDGAILVWGVDDQRLLLTRYGKEGRTLSANWIDSQTVITSASTGNLRVWTLKDERILKELPKAEILSSTAFSTDQRVAALGLRGNIQLHDMETGQVISRITSGKGDVTALAFSPNESQLLSASIDGHPLSPVISLVLWDTKTGNEIRRFNGHTGRIHRLSFSPDGGSFLSVSDDRQVILWEANTGDVRFRFVGPTDTSNAVAFSPDGKQMAVGFGTFRFVAHGEYLDNSIRVWDVANSQEQARLEGHGDAVVSIAFSSDGRSLLSGSIDTTVGLWDVSTGKLIHRLQGHASGVMSVAFSPDGHYAVSGSQDGMLIVWDLAKGEPVRQITVHKGVVHNVSFTLDGKSIWSASDAGDVILLNPILSLDDLFSWIGNNRYIPELPCDQRLLYGLVSKCDE